jgi:hypothetical protein
MVPDPKSCFITVRCTPETRAAYTAAAARAGLSVGAYLRVMAEGTAGPRARRRPPLEREAIAQLLGHVGRVGGNVNQIARALNMTGAVPQQAAIARAAEDISAIRLALMQALGREMPIAKAAGDNG